MPCIFYLFLLNIFYLHAAVSQAAERSRVHPQPTAACNPADPASCSSHAQIKELGEIVPPPPNVIKPGGPVPAFLPPAEIPKEEEPAAAVRVHHEPVASSEPEPSLILVKVLNQEQQQPGGPPWQTGKWKRRIKRAFGALAGKMGTFARRIGRLPRLFQKKDPLQQLTLFLKKTFVAIQDENLSGAPLDKEPSVFVAMYGTTPPCPPKKNGPDPVGFVQHITAQSNWIEFHVYFPSSATDDLKYVQIRIFFSTLPPHLSRLQQIAVGAPEGYRFQWRFGYDRDTGNLYVEHGPAQEEPKPLAVLLKPGEVLQTYASIDAGKEQQAVFESLWKLPNAWIQASCPICKTLEAPSYGVKFSQEWKRKCSSLPRDIDVQVPGHGAARSAKLKALRDWSPSISIQKPKAMPPDHATVVFFNIASRRNGGWNGTLIVRVDKDVERTINFTSSGPIPEPFLLSPFTHHFMHFRHDPNARRTWLEL